MSCKIFIALSLVIVLSVISGLSAQAADYDPGILIKKRLTEEGTSPETVIQGEPIYAAVLVRSFYSGRSYRRAWGQDGNFTQAGSLVKAIEESYDDGLTPRYYHLGLIKSLIHKVGKESSPAPALLADLDVLLTDAFLTLGCHLSGGCVNPVTIKAQWYAERGNVDVSAVLEEALKKKDIREAMMRFRPEDVSYIGLKQALARYREMSVKGDWPRVADGTLLKLHSLSGRVADLRKRLVASGDLEAGEVKGGDFFDERLLHSVVAFQKRHGLKADGVVGPATLSELNVSLKDRIRQIELNMERMRWILGNKEQRSIVVNIADFELYVIENGKPAFPMKVVVGKPYWHTPIFTAKMTYLIINPAWNVPDSIAREEILKKMKKGPDYLAKQNMEVLRGWGPGEETIARETVDWSRISAKNLPYRFRQKPGPLNPLGRLKFVLPNKFGVYLHDTPAKSLFSESVRTLSHGCIRIEKPVELAEYLLRGDRRWSREKIFAAIEKGTEQEVLIPQPINVHFLYLTAWIDAAGVLQFRDDVYGRDKDLDEALRSNPSLQ